MREAGKITAGAIEAVRGKIEPGVTLLQLDTIIRHYIEKHNATPTFLGYGGFPASACISINEQVIHGIPSDRALEDGDIVKIDVGACYKGYNGDMARTLFCGNVSDQAKKLAQVCKESFYKGMEKAVAGNRIGDISNAIYEHATQNGFSVVREYIGHGVGANLHEEPEIPNFGRAGRGPRLYPGMTLAIEPMINAGVRDVRVLKNKWTVVTADGMLSAHYENTVAVTDAQPEILTKI